jgi:hypothetical protein
MPSGQINFGPTALHHDQSCQIGETENSKVGGDDSNVVFGQKFPGEKGSVRWCIDMMQQPVILSPNFGSKSCRKTPQ